MKWFSFLLFSCFLLTSCTPSDPKEDINSVVYSYFEAQLIEDIDATMAYIHPDNENRYEINQERISTYYRYNYRYEVGPITFLSTNLTDAEIKVNVLTTGIEEEADRPVGFEMVYTFKLEKTSSGDWKILKEEISPF